MIQSMRGVLLTTVALLAFAAPAWADFMWTDSQVAARSSGIVTGGGQTERRLPNDSGVVGIQMRERKDDPIYIQILGRQLCDGVGGNCAGTSSSNREFFLREGRSGNIVSTKDINVGVGRFVTGLQVCSNGQTGNRAKIKGLRLWGGEIASNGNVTTTGAPVEFQRQNCSSWRARVNCPANQVMVGLRVHHGSRNGASAFRPICARVNTD